MSHYGDIEESIYDLIPQPQARAIKQPMHRSKYPPNTAPTASTFGSASRSQVPVANLSGHYEDIKRVHSHTNRGGTFGPGSHFADPTSFKKKRSGHPKLATPSKFTYESKMKAKVVTRKEGLQNFKATRREPRRDHIQQNALSVIAAGILNYITNFLLQR
jgi:hypothetical protein